MAAATKPKSTWIGLNVTGMYVGARDARTYVIVTYGNTVEHVRVHDEHDAAVQLHRLYGVPLARARRMVAAVTP